MLEVRDIRKRFGRTDVLRGVSLSIDHGCLAILGPNGAGKTTLIRCLAGLIRSDSGTVEVDGTGPSSHLSSGSFGYLPQRFDFFKELTAAEALRYIATLSGIDRREIENQVKRVLALVNLSDRETARIKFLSGGMLRRLGIAQTLLGSPQTLLYDEPTTGLDPEERARFKALLISMRAEHRILLSTHIVDDVKQVCDAVLVMNEGRVLFSGSPDELRERARGRVRVSKDIVSISPWSSQHVFSSSVQQDGVGQHRIVCRERREDCSVEPTLDDGYLAVVHHFDE